MSKGIYHGTIKEEKQRKEKEKRGLFSSYGNCQTRQEGDSLIQTRKMVNKNLHPPIYL